MKIIKKIAQVAWNLLIAGALFSAAMWVGSFALSLIGSGVQVATRSFRKS